MKTFPLTKGYSVIVDDDDADLLALGYWASASSPTKVYAKRYIRGSKPYRSVYLHRDIAERSSGEIPKGFDVDHINGDTLDCRRANMRVVSHQRNMWNRARANRDSASGIRGVRFKRDRGKWQAHITRAGKTCHLGYFGTAEEARAARETAERERELSIAA